MRYELILRGVSPNHLDEMDMDEVQELFIYLQYHRKYIISTDLAMGIQRGITGNK